MIIAVDLDEVLSDTMPSLIKFHNETFNTKLRSKDFHSYEFWRVWGGTKSQSIAKFLQFTQSPYFLEVLPIKDSVQSVKYLSKKHKLYVVTSRQTHLTDATHIWVNQYFPDIFQGLHVTNHPQWAVAGEAKTKSQVCQEIGANLLIDDSIGYAMECETIDIPVLLFDYPWNKGKLPKNTKRVFSWKGVLEVLDTR